MATNFETFFGTFILVLKKIKFKYGEKFQNINGKFHFN